MIATGLGIVRFNKWLLRWKPLSYTLDSGHISFMYLDISYQSSKGIPLYCLLYFKEDFNTKDEDLYLDMADFKVIDKDRYKLFGSGLITFDQIHDKPL